MFNNNYSIIWSLQCVDDHYTDNIVEGVINSNCCGGVRRGYYVLSHLPNHQIILDVVFVLEDIMVK